jgi:hypothetical protein
MSRSYTSSPPSASMACSGTALLFTLNHLSYCIHCKASVITLVMDVVRTSETSFYSNETARRFIPEGSHLHTRRRENLKSVCVTRVSTEDDCIEYNVT